MKNRTIEIRERAITVLGLTSMFTSGELIKNFRRQIKLVNPNSTDADKKVVGNFSNLEVAMLIIQAYLLLYGKEAPTTMLENDEIVGNLIGSQNITPIDETFVNDKFDLLSHYEYGGGWPEPSEKQKKQLKYKFKGL